MSLDYVELLNPKYALIKCNKYGSIWKISTMNLETGKVEYSQIKETIDNIQEIEPKVFRIAPNKSCINDFIEEKRKEGFEIISYF